MRTRIPRVGWAGRLGLAVIGLALGLSLVAISTRAEDTPQPEPVAGIKDIMNAVNHKGWGLYGMILKDSRGEVDDRTWTLIANRAAVIAEAGNLLMGLSDDCPRGDQSSWLQHCADYREAANAVRKAAARQQLEKMREAIAALGQQCDACHADHQLQ